MGPDDVTLVEAVRQVMQRTPVAVSIEPWSVTIGHNVSWLRAVDTQNWNILRNMTAEWSDAKG
jgi:hypothetical protein